MIRNIKTYGHTTMVALMVVMLVTSVPLGYISLDHNEPNVEEAQAQATQVQFENSVDDWNRDKVEVWSKKDIVENTNLKTEKAKGIAPVVVYGGVLAAGAVGGIGVGYTVNDFFDDGSEVTKEQLEDEIENSTNEELRQATHTAAIISQGTNEAYLDRVDNDLSTTEGQLDQVVSSSLIRKGNNITTKAEAISVAENAADDYLRTRLLNHVETHNFNVLSVQQYKQQLDEANYSGDIGTYDRINIISRTVFGNIQFEDNNKMIIEVRSDFNVVTGKSKLADSSFNGDVVIDLNGHTIIQQSGTDPDMYALSLAGNNSSVTLKNGTIVGDVFVGYTKGANFLNVDITGDLDKRQTEDKLYIDSDSNISESSDLSNPVDLNMVRKITYNTTDIANANSNYNSSEDVPTVTLSDNGTNVTLPAVKIPIDSSYMPDGYVKVATPYTTNGNPLHDGIGNVIIETPTSNVTDYAEPHDGVRSINLIDRFNSVSSSAYTQVSSYASSVWNNSLSTVSEDPDMNITDLPNVTKELSQLTSTNQVIDDPKDVRSLYIGLYESTTDPMSDNIKIEEVNGNQSYTGIVFSRNITSVLNSSNMSKLQTGDRINTSKAHTFIVSKDTGEKYELYGEWKITNIIGQESLDIRNYDVDSTDLSDIAEQVEDQKDSIEVTIDDNSGGGGFGGDSNSILIIVGAIVVLGVLFREE